MMFWIMVPGNIIVVLAMHFSLKGMGKTDGNMILGVKIPKMQRKDERVQVIVTEYEAKFKKLFWPMMLLQIVGYPLKQWVSISLLWVFLYIAIVIGAYTYCAEHYARKLRNLKKEEGWTKECGHVLNIDTEVSRLKHTFPISRKWFGVPVVIVGIFCYWKMEQVQSIFGMWILITVLVIFLTGVLLYEIFARVSSATYSENTDINIALNKAYKGAWTRYGVLISYTSVLYLPLLSMINAEHGYSRLFIIYIVIIVVLSSILSVIPMLVIHHKLQKLKTKLLQAEVEEYYVDDDEFWTVFTYNNPYDKRTWVTKRVGIGTTMNMATAGGKIFAYSAMVITVATILWSMWISIPIDFDTIAMEENETYYEVGIWGDYHKIQKSEVSSIELLEELPTTYKNVGSSTSRMKTGIFSVKGYGQSVVYIMVEVPLYIAIELEDESYVFINGEDVETTMEYYELLMK